MVTVLSGHNEASDGQSGGQSIDHHIGNTIGLGTKFPSLQFAVINRYGGGIVDRASQSAPPMEDPYIAFDRIFGQTMLPNQDPAVLARIGATAEHFDHVTGELTALQGHVSAQDRSRIDIHLESVREVEKRLQSTTSLACAAPTQTQKLDPKSDVDAPAIGRLHMDMIAADIRVPFDAFGNHAMEPWDQRNDLPPPRFQRRAPSVLALEAGDRPDVAAKLSKINVYFAEQFAYLLGKLDGIVEADGKTVLDYTVAWWTSEVATGGHSLDNIPTVIAGGAGAFRMGRSLQVPLQPHNAAILAIANAVGAGVPTFGEPAYCANGPLNLA